MSDYAQYRIGVLALQGAVSEHMAQITALGAQAVAVKQVAQLADLDALVLPGGESTAIGKLMVEYGFIDAIRTFAASGKALFGTCAGMILLASEIEGQSQPHLDLIAIRVRRNASGRQVSSYQADLAIKDMDAPFPAVFIRAPYVSELLADDVEVLAEVEKNNPVLVRQGNILACSFHPELSDDGRVMRLFLDMIG
ncbi:pyridoxal 5'-phosphate synthase glutaminase subunit PdxT [Cardiobacteriaceae bacterium TAE3-ERU3]|nr:pyridoxal 5'-phosphate synthase glutaminase subunit PdxT [Cardiobacteriaceae bacterium TAE3-ERU3]